MAKQSLSLDTIGDLDQGKARLAVDREIGRAIEDLIDRGAEDKKERKVVVELTMNIVDGLVVTQVAAQAKLPALKTGATVAEPKYGVAGKPVLMFQEFAPDNPEQGTIDAMDRKPGEK